LKVWPVLLLLAVPRRAMPRALAGFAVTAAAVLATLMVTMDGAASFASEQRARGLQIESVPALVFLLGHHIGWDRTFIYRYGAMEVEAAGVATAAMIVTVAGIVVLAGLLGLRLSGRLDRALPADIALVAVLVSMVTSRVLSPQYLVWTAAIAAVCLLDPATRMRPVIVVLMPTAALGQILYPMHYDWLMSDAWHGVAIQTVRIALLLLATVWGLWRLLRPAPSAPVRVDAVEQVRQTA
jgi:hypothetical protein